MNSHPTTRRLARSAGSLLAGATMLATTILLGSTAAQAATTATTGGGEAGAAAANAFTEIRNVETRLCLQPLARGESSLVQVACNGSAVQQWIFVPNRNGNHIVNQADGLCVYMDGPVSSGSPVIQTGCSGVSNDDWKAAVPPAVTRIMSRAAHRDTNLCLAPESGVGGALMRIFTCNDRPIQQWVVGV